MPGVYVKGMEMPVQCVSCPLWRVSYIIKPMDICGAVPKKIEQPYGGRPEWCPLVEVPAHGRLIDGDKLSECCNEPYWWNSEIDDAPTIIPADEEEEDG